MFHFAHHRYTQDRARDPELATASPATLAAYLWRVSGLPGIVVLSLYLHSAAAVIYWLVPAMLGEPFVRLFLLAEHTGCAFDEDMLANTRTTYTNPAVLLLTWRMPYHAEHHSFPSVPFHALVRVNKLLPAAGRVTSRGYVAWHRALLRQLRAAAH